MTGPPTPLHRARAEASATCHRQALKALSELEAAGAQISFSAVARRARVARSTLYANPEVRAAIELRRAAQQERRRTARQTATPDTRSGQWHMRARNAETAIQQLEIENAKLRRRVLHLEGLLADLHDDAERDADARVLDLLQQREATEETLRRLAAEVTDLRAQLAAARHQNRFLARTAQQNTPR